MWIPAMVGYACCVATTIVTLIVDLALTALVGLLSLAACFQSEALNGFRDGCVYSLYYDLQCLSVALVGVLVPEGALHLRVHYFYSNAVHMCCDLIQSIARRY
jgi:hypothetical protein